MLNTRIGSILDGLGMSRIDEARKKKSKLPIEFVVVTDKGDNDKRASFKIELGSPYSVKFTKGSGTVVRDDVFNLNVLGNDVVEDEEYENMNKALDTLELFIQKGKNLMKKVGADFSYHGRPDRITGKVSAEAYGCDIYLNDNSMYKEVEKVLKSNKIL